MKGRDTLMVRHGPFVASVKGPASPNSRAEADSKTFLFSCTAADLGYVDVDGLEAVSRSARMAIPAQRTGTQGPVVKQKQSKWKYRYYT